MLVKEITSPFSWNPKSFSKSKPLGYLPMASWNFWFFLVMVLNFSFEKSLEIFFRIFWINANAFSNSELFFLNPFLKVVSFSISLYKESFGFISFCTLITFCKVCSIGLISLLGLEGLKVVNFSLGFITGSVILDVLAHPIYICMSADASLHSYIASPQDNSYRTCCSRTFGRMKRGSQRRAIFSLLFSILSPGCIILPLSLNSTGAFPTVLLIALAGIITCISLNHLSVATYRLQIFDYYSLVYHGLGKNPGHLIGFLMFLHWGILAISYQVLLCLFIPHIYKPFSVKLSSVNEKMLTLFLSNFFITLPLSMFKDLENTNVTKIINGVGVTYVICINFYQYFQTWSIEYFNWFSINLTSSITFACALHTYSGYYYLPQLQGTMYEPNPERSHKVIIRSLIALFLFFLTVTASSCKEFTYFKPSWAAVSGEMMLAFNLIALVPNTIVTLRNIFFDLCDFEPSTLG